jgi:hypothetical protein
MSDVVNTEPVESAMDAEQIHRAYWGDECHCPPGTIFGSSAHGKASS